jgi:hypothetical protein
MTKLNFARIAGIFGTLALTVFLQACATQGTAIANDQTEQGLLRAGFRVRPIATVTQRDYMRRMPDDEFTMVNQGGNTYYLYIDRQANRLYVGDKWAYRAYQGYVRNNHLRKQGVFVWEVNPSDPANNRTVDVWPGYPPFRSF